MTADDALLMAVQNWMAARYPQSARSAPAQARALAALFLSPVCRQVVDHLTSNQADHASGIARAVSRTSASKLRSLLKDMVDRGILARDGRGYTLAAAVRPLLPLFRGE